MGAAPRGPRRPQAAGVEPVEFCRVPGALLRQLRSVAGPGFADELARHWQAHLDDAESIVVSLGSGTAEQRLARLLLKLTSADGGIRCVPLPRAELGALLGVSTETASRLMARFRRSGLIDGTRSRLRCDADRLRRAARGIDGSQSRPAHPLI